MLSLQANSLKKVYDRRIVFQNVSLAMREADVLAITGANGSGKSTLLKLLAAIASPTSGDVRYGVGEKAVPKEELFLRMGFVAPYLNFYDELTGIENVAFALRAKGKRLEGDELDALFDYFRLSDAKNRRVKTYSSGMVQRLRFIQAFASEPRFLFLDEPTATLDDSGKELFWNKLNRVASQTIVVIASNDRDEIARATRQLCVEDYKPTKAVLA